MGIQPASADLIASRLGNECFTKTGEHRSRDHDRTSESAALFLISLAAQIIDIDRVRLEYAGIPLGPLDLYTHFFQQIDQEIDIQDIRNVRNSHLFGSQQDGA